MSSRSGSSRRKPAQVSRAVCESSSDEDGDTDKVKKVNGDSQSEEDILEELPEGTVVVNPEPVEEKNPTFKGPEFVSGKRKNTGVIDASGLMSRVTCTACHKQINTNKKGSARRHPLLKVLICKRCRGYYDSGPIQKDKDGLDEQCRWCGEGGRLFGCDFCHNAFCRSCIIHNLGRSELMRVQNDDKWKCYVCNSKALRPQRHECEAVLEQIKKEEQKAKNALEREKEREKNKEKKDTSKNTPSSKSSDTIKNTPPSKSSDSVRNTPSSSSKANDLKHSNVNSAAGKITPGSNPKVELVVVGPKNPIAIQPKPMPVNITPQQKPLGPAQRQLKNLLIMPTASQQNVQRVQKPHVPTIMKSQMPVSNQVMGNVGFVSSLDPVSITLPMLIEEFKKNVTPTTIPQVLAKLMSITNSLTLLMSSIKMNIMDNRFSSPGFESVSAMNLQSRKTAVDCLVSGLELFLQELQITTVGEYRPQPKEKNDYMGANGSTENNSGNDSEPEVVTIDSPTKTPTKKPLKMTMVDDQIVVESDSDDEVIPVRTDDSQKVDLKKGRDEKMESENNSKSEDKKTDEKPTEDKSSIDESMEVESSTSVDESKEKLDQKSKEKSPKKQSSTGKESPKKANKSSREKEETDNVDSENAEAQLELLKELADELIKNGKKTDSESDDGNTDCDDDEDNDNTSQNKEQDDKEAPNVRDDDGETIAQDDDEETNVQKDEEVTNVHDDDEETIVQDDEETNVQDDEEETEKVQEKEKRDESKIKSPSKVKKSKKNNKENKEDENKKTESDEEEEDNQNKPVSSASNDDTDSDSESSDASGPRRRLRKRNSKKEDQKPEKTSKGSLKLRLRLPAKTKLPQKEEKKSERRSSRSKTVEESQDSDEKSSKSKGKDKKGKAKKKSVESDSENFDSDLEDEIDKLAKNPKVQKKKKKVKEEKEEEEEEEEVKPKKGNKKESKNEKDKKSKGKKEETVDSDSSEGTDNYDPDEAAEEEKEEEEEEEPMDTVDPAPDLSDKESSATDMDGGDEDSDDSSDSEVIINSPKKKKGGKAGSKKAKESESSDSDAPKKKKRLRSKLLDAKLSESDDSDFEKPKKGRGKKRKAKTDSSEDESTEEDSDAPKKKGRGKKSAQQKGKKGTQKKRRRIKAMSDSSDEKMSTEGEEELKNEKKKKKKKKKGSDDSEDDSDEEGDGDGSPSKGRKKIRKIKSDKKLTDTTRKAVKAEEERRKRIAEKQKEFNNVVVEDDPSSSTKCPITKQLVLDYDKETKEPIIEVDERLITKLKPHQVEAVQFMWDCTIESVERTKKEKGAGCILAHCMGLGKTLSVITYLHTVMNHSELTGVTKALVVGPLNTVLNWQHEFQTWLSGDLGEDFYEVFEISNVKQNVARADMLKHWHKNGGVMIMGYEMFRNLSQGNHCRSKKLKQIFRETLVDPGPDICVCDEGHILKNDASSISKAMNQIITLKRIVLTGTPLQNNLVEYHCMVNFVKPNLLGTRKEFCNRFVNPIVNGQCTDSSPHDVRLMKRRAHIIHEKLAGCVQRKDYSALTKFLSPKYEYVISVRLSKVQIELYQKYLDKTGSVNNVMGKGAKLFSDYQALMRIWTHPWVLKMDEERQEKKEERLKRKLKRKNKAKWDDEDSFVDDGSLSEAESMSDASKSSSSESDVVAISDNSSDEDDGRRKTRGRRDEAGSSKNDSEEVIVNAKGEVVKKWTTRSRGGEGTEWEGIIKAAEEEEDRPLTTDWWADYVTEEDAHKIELSGKLSLLFEILRMSEEIGDKVLVFSQSLLSLDLIEDFLEHVDKKHQEETEERERKRKEAEEEKNDDEENEDDKEKKDKDKEKDEPEENVFGKQWTKGADYFRMDGSTSAQHRKELAASFNDPENYRARLFIISTKAGGLGINLVAANRVIIFDASWNPSNDVQSVFRVYRFGQDKPVFIYRFLAQGTMEEKIYERQVTKQSLSQRVVDEHQIERHFTSQDLQVLYTFKPDRLDDPNREERPTPELPKDHMLAEMLQSHKEWICSYHKHDSLLENQIDEELTEEERKAAWKEFEEEKQGIANNVRQQFMGMNNFQGMAGAMGPGINMNMLMQQGLRFPGMGGMPGSNMPFNQQNLLQLVQDMKTRFPNLPEDQLTARVQGVIRHMITSQYMQQQEMQKRQLEQREMQHQQQLHQIQAQIQRQQQQLNAHQRMGSNFGNR